jgi:hypothetical protein
VAFGLLLATYIVAAHYENTRKHQCSVVGFETATFANFDAAELSHPKYDAANVKA